MAARADSTVLRSSGSAPMTGSVRELYNCLRGQLNDSLCPKERAGQAGGGARKDPCTQAKWSEAVGSGLAQPRPEARRLPLPHLGCRKRHLSGNQEASVYVPILLLAIVVTLEPGKSTLYISIDPSIISLGHSHNKNTNQKQQNCFDYH